MTLEVKVPDIGDFTDVPVIEIHVGAGDTVAVEDPLVTLESEKATMDVPAPVAGTVSELRVAIGDKVSEGSVLLTMDAEQDAAVTSGEEAPAAGLRRGLRRRSPPRSRRPPRPRHGPPMHRPRRVPTARSTTPRSS